MQSLRNHRSVRFLATLAISLAFVALLLMAVDWRESVRLLNNGVSITPLIGFAAMSIAIAVGYSYRWRMLLCSRINLDQSFYASLIGLGGNMVLPARGGDILRVHYSHIRGGISYAEAIGALFAEKLVDIITILAIGAISIYILAGAIQVDHEYVLLGSFVVVLALTAGIVVLLKFFTERILAFLMPPFRLFKMDRFFDLHVKSLIESAAASLSFSRTLVPAALTLALWLSAYAFAYYFIASSIGVNLGYGETLIILFAGALGLMIPAAPSGIGTFHASVVSAFIMLGKPAAEGLLLATTVHLLFFIIYVVPAVLVLGRWRLGHVALR